MLGTQTESVVIFNPQVALERARPRRHVLISEVYDSGHFILGRQLASFEKELAAAFGGEDSAGCGNGTAALELCLREAGIQTNDDVIVPANTSLFTAQAVLAAGARLRFADVDPRTLQLTRETAEAAWTERTRAVIGVHLFGNACPVDELADLCRKRGATLIQDACQAHGLRFKGRPLTDYSPYTAYSFYPTKNLGGVEDGGAVVTDSAAIAERLRLLRNGGRDNDQLARVPAINSRMSELHAAHLRAMLPDLEHWNEHRRRIADLYCQRLSGVQIVDAGTGSVRHQFVIRTPQRDRLRAELAEAGIETAIHYPIPLHLHPAFEGRSSWAEEPQETVRASKEIVSLPIGPHVSEEAAERVADAVQSVLR